jgi:hypothetical protein
MTNIHGPLAGAPDPKIVERIRRALAIAKDQSGKPEGDTASRLAENMLRAHAISMAEVSDAESRASDPMMRREFDLGARSNWRRRLIWAVAQHCALVGHYQRNATAFVLFGHSSSIAVAEYLYDVIIRQVVAEADRYGNGLPSWHGRGQKHKLHNDFCHSAVTAIDHRLRAMRSGGATADPTGTALVLSRAKAAETFMHEKIGKLGKGRARGTNWNAEGHEAGKRVRIVDGVEARAEAASRYKAIGGGA